ncbi:MAG: hypothetical protein ABGZ35_11135, partial [Planctomycetaceae bacterium]
GRIRPPTTLESPDFLCKASRQVVTRREANGRSSPRTIDVQRHDCPLLDLIRQDLRTSGIRPAEHF